MIETNRIAFLVGMPRAATTFLYHNLNLHPKLFVTYRRKTNYFSLHYSKGEDWFISHFKDAPINSLAIDTETLAFMNRTMNSPKRIKAFNKEAKVILCVRDPAAWAISLYHQIATFDDGMPDFDSFLAGNYTLREDGIETNFRMDDGNIYARIREYEELFPNSILLLKFREVTDLPLESLRRIERFLEIPNYYKTENIIAKKINSSKRKHNKLLNRLLRNEFLITLTRTLLPRKAVLAMRWMFDGLLTREAKRSSERVAKEEEIQMLNLAQNHYKSDIKALKDYI
jgi:hypothetical protein